ncbi:MAG: ADP-ribosylglycohydrolase family protein [Magnetococcales bacterium]|nr:ADP-ribosylglycohydrolase family protein [Magnetococcales bacterium]
MGLPWEGLSPNRLRKMAYQPGRFNLFLGRGFCSDDTEHACMTAEALLRSRGESERFIKSLAWRLRFWLLLLPAGVGMATARACLKLWLGFPPKYSGVYSAGNGPAMRAPVLGIMLGDDPQALHQHVTLSTRLTHTDPLAVQGALVVAWATWLAGQQREVTPDSFMAWIQSRLTGDGSDQVLSWLNLVKESLARQEDTATFAQSLGLTKGVSGYMGHTLPVAIHAWLSHPTDFPQAIHSVISLGGDTDTVAAIVGSIVGAGVGYSGLPQEWLTHLWEWPRTGSWMVQLTNTLATSYPTPAAPPAIFYPVLLFRNLFFLCIVLLHGFRRLAPPYGS